VSGIRLPEIKKLELEVVMEEDVEKKTDYLSHNNANKAIENASIKNPNIHLDKNSNLGKETETNSLVNGHGAFKNRSSDVKKSNILLLILANDNDKTEEVQLEKIQIEFREN
jgi:hypothetical protein